jgi:WD40 repeat protein
MILWNSVKEFAETYSEVIFNSIPHIYVSALLFTPRESPFMKIHASLLQNLPTQLNQGIYPGTCIDLSKPRCQCQYLACSPDGLSLFSGCARHSLWHRWKILADGSVHYYGRMLTPPYIDMKLSHITVSPEQGRAMGIANETDICIWDVEEIGILKIIYPPLRWVRRLVFHPTDRNQLVTFTVLEGRRRSGVIHFWDLQLGTPRNTIGVKTRRGTAYTDLWLTWSPDGTYLALGVRSHTFIWRIDSATGAVTLQRRLDLRVDNISFSPATHSHVLLSSKTGISLYDLESGRDIRDPYRHTIPPRVNYQQAIFSPDGSLIAIFCRFLFAIEILEADGGSPYQDPIVAPSAVIQVIFLPDGKRIAALCQDGIYTWELCHRLKISDQEQWDRANSGGHLGPVTSVSFSPDGRKFLSTSRDGTVHVRSVADCMLLREYWPMNYPCAVSRAVFGTDNKTVYVALEDCTVYVSSGMKIYTPTNHDET